jgi:hypothetical protein
MKQLNDTLTVIARKHLGVPTLKARRSDSLDFHDLSVWQIRAALNAAYVAGTQHVVAAIPSDPTLPVRFDRYEIHGIKRFTVIPGSEDEPQSPPYYEEQVAESEAEFWSLFGHIPGRGADCIGDFETREHAEEVYARITGRRYTGSADR